MSIETTRCWDCKFEVLAECLYVPSIGRLRHFFGRYPTEDDARRVAMCREHFSQCHGLFPLDLVLRAIRAREKRGQQVMVEAWKRVLAGSFPWVR